MVFLVILPSQYSKFFAFLHPFCLGLRKHRCVNPKIVVPRHPLVLEIKSRVLDELDVLSILLVVLVLCLNHHFAIQIAHHFVFLFWRSMFKCLAGIKCLNTTDSFFHIIYLATDCHLAKVFFHNFS